MKNIKILFVITRADIGGAQNHIELLIKHIPDTYDFVLCSGSDGPLIDVLNAKGVKTHIIPNLDSKTFFPAFFAIKKIINKEKPDLIHTHSAIASFIGRIAGWVSGVKTLYTVHGWHFVPNTSLAWRVLGWLLEIIARPCTDAWITVSRFDKELGVSSGVVNRQKTWIVPNGVEDLPLNPKSESEGILKMVFVARASHEKNCIEAIEVLECSDSNVHLTMYVTTDDQLPSLQEKVDSSKRKADIDLIIDDYQAGSKLSQYDVILLTSRYEGMPLCLLEGMRAGLAIIASDVCGLNELVKQNENGFLYTLYDPAEASYYVNKLLDVEKRQSFGNCSRKLFDRQFLAHHMAERTNEVYQRLLS